MLPVADRPAVVPPLHVHGGRVARTGFFNTFLIGMRRTVSASIRPYMRLDDVFRSMLGLCG